MCQNGIVGYKLVLISWHDAATRDKWLDLENDLPDSGIEPCMTSGFLMRETDREYVIAHTIGGDEYCGEFSIPKQWATVEIVLEGIKHDAILGGRNDPA